jgi:glycosyltransferase involved in cell wall biosynthesis
VAISDAQRRLAPDLPWVGTVHNAVPVGEYPFREEKEDYVLFLGRMSPEKGVHLAVDAATGWGGLWMVVSLVVLAMAVPLQERLFAVAGLAGVFVYLARLVFDVFETANAALVLVVIGLLVLGAGMLYQRYTGRFLPGARA